MSYELSPTDSYLISSESENGISGKIASLGGYLHEMPLCFVKKKNTKRQR